MAAPKNSLVANINRRKKAGTSRPKSRSTIAPESYEQMEAGWGKKKKRAKAKKKQSKRGAPKTVSRKGARSKR